MTNKELLEQFKKVNSSVNIKEWYPLINDKCEEYANTSEPILKVVLDDGSWMRVYISKKYNEVTWY